MFEPVAHGDELADRPVELRRLVGQHAPVDARFSVGRKHARDLVERKAGGAAERDQRQPVQHIMIENAAQPTAADRGDQLLLLVEAQRRCRNGGAPRDFGNIDPPHLALDLK